ncbi:hypothetical protein P7K49_023513 [Saguinus oedipus]|uniref:CDT1 Geminin-binding domain-containing protein n=1 Tax=Saguinus oedipus TaxID=9490 RepID=A0ABQ9UP57_SAGOE|nr:hypothetical protein P7K49_023513 [Saguinus oedipus]
MLGSPTRQRPTNRGAQRRHGATRRRLAIAFTPPCALPAKAAAAKMFHSVDSVVGTLYNGCKMTTFAKVKQGVRNMMLKRFGERNVATSELWRLPFKVSARTAGPHFQGLCQVVWFPGSLHTIKPGLDQEPSGAAFNSSLAPSLFSQEMVGRVKEHHEVFLASLSTPGRCPRTLQASGTRASTWMRCWTWSQLHCPSCLLLSSSPPSEKSQPRALACCRSGGRRP